MTTHDSSDGQSPERRPAAQNRRSEAARKLMVTMLIALSGGTTFATCQSRFRDATVQASKDFVLSLFDPTTIVQTVLGTTPPTTGG